ncbi:MAG: HNH endonuclease, partial [Acidobacteria bacterium]|nr:HNH endonuclease [Acidobacteriota bacterium]
HEAYDRGLMGITPDYGVEVSESARRRLQRLARDHGWSDFRDNLRPDIILPDRAQDRPDPDRLAQGLQLRGWH